MRLDLDGDLVAALAVVATQHGARGDGTRHTLTPEEAVEAVLWEWLLRLEANPHPEVAAAHLGPLHASYRAWRRGQALRLLQRDPPDHPRPCTPMNDPTPQPQPRPSTEDDAYALEMEASADDVHRCRVCGCTDDDCRACIERTGRPCHWVEQDLCSACHNEPTR